MKTVFMLNHFNNDFKDGHIEEKLIGVYSSRKLAESKILQYQLLEGFKDYPTGFRIDEYVVDETWWKGGFTPIIDLNLK